MGLIWSPLVGDPADLVVLDATRRFYVGLSRDGSYYHAVQPDASGALRCTCAGGRAHGHCWRTSQAQGFETGQREWVEWFPQPAEARHEALLYGAVQP